MPALVFSFAGLLAMVAFAVFWARYEAFTGLDSPAQNQTDRSIHVVGYLVNGWLLVILAIAFFYMLIAAIRVFRDSIANQGEALWIEGGRLVYADKKILDVSLRDVVSVDLNRQRIYNPRLILPHYYTMMVFRLRDGKEVKFPPSRFVENRDDLISQFREKIGLTASV
jgi:hypothetical protein